MSNLKIYRNNAKHAVVELNEREETWKAIKCRLHDKNYPPNRRSGGSRLDFISRRLGFLHWTAGRRC